MRTDDNQDTLDNIDSKNYRLVSSTLLELEERNNCLKGFSTVTIRKDVSASNEWEQNSKKNEVSDDSRLFVGA